jgi:division/cell wall cluster transcriptional repressor MraZ
VKTLARLLTSRAADCDLDRQGRVLLPPSLRAAAGLAREAVVVGVLNRIEIWAPVAWDAFLRDSERMLDDVSLDVQWPPAPAPPAEPPHTPVQNPPDPTRRPQAKPYR